MKCQLIFHLESGKCQLTPTHLDISWTLYKKQKRKHCSNGAAATISKYYLQNPEVKYQFKTEIDKFNHLTDQLAKDPFQNPMTNYVDQLKNFQKHQVCKKPG